MESTYVQLPFCTARQMIAIWVHRESFTLLACNLAVSAML